MSDLIAPKYSVGTTVYVPDVERETEQLPCPDCLGTKTWRVTTPAGTTAECECMRCSTRYHIADLPSLTRVIYKPLAKPFTIGKIETSTHPWSRDDKVTYYSGPNGGSTWGESKVHETPDTALLVAKVIAAELQAKEDAKPASIEAARLARLTVRIADFEQTKKSRWDSWWAYRHLADDVRDAIESEDETTVEELMQALEEHLSFAAKYRDLPDVGQALKTIRAHATPEIETALALLEGTITPPAGPA